jgi:hypothetical protein
MAGRPIGEVWADLPPWRPEELALVDELADLLLAADAGDQAADAKLASWYAEDPRLHPGDVIACYSPRGVNVEVDLRRRSSAVSGPAIR